MPVFLEFMCGQKVSVCAAAAPIRLNRLQPATAVTVFHSASHCVVITAEALVLFELSREESPPQQHQSVY